MLKNLNLLLDKISDYLAHRKGLLPLLGVLFISINYLLQFFLDNWVTQSNLFLHMGIILAIIGFIVAWAL
jgi:hypothetical protein